VAQELYKRIVENEEEISQLRAHVMSAASDFKAGECDPSAISLSRVLCVEECDRREEPLARIAEAFVRVFWERHPEAVYCLDEAIEAWTSSPTRAMGEKTTSQRAQEFAASFGTSATTDEVVLEWLLADNASRRKRLPECARSPVQQRQLKQLHEDAAAQQALVVDLLSTPDSPGRRQLPPRQTSVSHSPPSRYGGTALCGAVLHGGGPTEVRVCACA
jgi:hypothetical protein